MMLVFCLGVGFSGTKLGECWVILEERWPHLFAGGSRQPYMDIAEKALGRPGRWVVPRQAGSHSAYTALPPQLLILILFWFCFVCVATRRSLYVWH